MVPRPREPGAQGAREEVPPREAQADPMTVQAAQVARTSPVAVAVQGEREGIEPVPSSFSTLERRGLRCPSTDTRRSNFR